MDFSRLEITTKIGCSVNCAYCPQSTLVEAYTKPGQDRPLYISLETFRRCVDKLPAQTRIDFSGFGEPWLNHECTEMILYAHEKGFPITVYSTLVGMTLDDFERIKHIPFEEFVLHLPDNKGNTPLPITDEYKEMVRRVVETKRANGLQWVTDYSCHGEAPAEELLPLLPDPAKTSKTVLIDRAGLIDKEGVAHCCADTETVCINGGSGVNHNVLLPDGTVVLCCMDFGLRHVLGNLLRESWADIHNSDEARRVSAGFSDRSVHTICKKCSNAISVDSLYNRYMTYRMWIKNLKEKNEETILSLNAYKTDCGTLKAKNEEMLSSLEICTANYSKVSEEVVLLNREQQALKNNIAISEAERGKAVAQMHAVTSKFHEEKEARTELICENDRLKAGLLVAADKANSALTELADAQDKLASVKEENDKMEKDLKQLKSHWYVKLFRKRMP